MNGNSSDACVPRIARPCAKYFIDYLAEILAQFYEEALIVFYTNKLNNISPFST